MTPTDDPQPHAVPEPPPPVPDPARPVLPPITRVNSRILYAFAIFALLVIWVVTFTVTSRHPQIKPPAPPQTQDSAPNLDSLASLAERVRAAQEMQKKLAATKRPGPFDPLSLGAREPAEDASPATGAGDRDPWASRHHASGLPASSSEAPPARYAPEPAREPQPSPAKTRLEQALSAPPLIAPTTRAAQSEGSEPATADPTGRLVDLLARKLPGDGSPPVLRSSPSGETGDPRADLQVPRATATARLISPQRALSPYVLYEGTILPAVLTSELTSDLPGIATATLRSAVYDSPSGSHLLLPPGTRALGRYETNLAQGDSRLLVSWHRLILPDGRFFEIPLSAAADVHGATGLVDRTDRHLGRAFTSTLLLSILGAGAQLSQPSNYSNAYGPPSAGEIAAGAAGQQISHLSTNLLERDLQVKPTLTIRPGTAFGIVLQSDLVFAAAYAAASEAGR